MVNDLETTKRIPLTLLPSSLMLASLLLLCPALTRTRRRRGRPLSQAVHRPDFPAAAGGGDRHRSRRAGGNDRDFPPAEPLAQSGAGPARRGKFRVGDD